MSWHADPTSLTSYRDGALDEVSSFSVEAHLISCSTCRAHAASLVEQERLERVWSGIEEAVDAPRLGVIERVLLRLRIPDHVARVLAATPSLSLSWLLAVMLVLAFAVVAAHQSERGVLVFLAVAPLLPLAGVAAAYGPGIDPAYEIALAAPLRTFRLLMIRAAAVLTVTVVLVGLAALALPGLAAVAAAWLLPALALALASLALSSYVPPLLASGSLALAWICAVGLGVALADDRLAAFQPPGQLAFALIAALAALVIGRRRDAFETTRGM
jgi:hypothetical protein